MKKIKKIDTFYADYMITLSKHRRGEFTICAWYKSQQVGATTPAIIIDGSFNSAAGAYLSMGESIAKKESVNEEH